MYKFLMMCILCYNVYYLFEKPQCNICTFDKCSNRYISSYCTTLQYKNHDFYMEFIKNTTEEFDELTKLRIYSELFGEKMESCVRHTRSYCVDTFCKNCRFPYPIDSFKYSSSFVDKDVDVSEFKPSTRDVIFDVVSKEEYQRLADNNECVFRNINIKQMYSDCHISLFREECLEKYREKIRDECKK